MVSNVFVAVLPKNGGSSSNFDGHILSNLLRPPTIRLFSLQEVFFWFPTGAWS